MNKLDFFKLRVETTMPARKFKRDRKADLSRPAEYIKVNPAIWGDTRWLRPVSRPMTAASKSPAIKYPLLYYNAPAQISQVQAETTTAQRGLS